MTVTAAPDWTSSPIGSHPSCSYKLRARAVYRYKQATPIERACAETTSWNPSGSGGQSSNFATVTATLESGSRCVARPPPFRPWFERHDLEVTFGKGNRGLPRPSADLQDARQLRRECKHLVNERTRVVRSSPVV
jgi:hypothetical protein